ncbi:MAG: hypothetical protein IJI71_08505 [Clostridia bacterium]|nr:hypothetical protein [Clostridia bacterium]
MTPKDFAKQCNVRLSTVFQWIEKKYIDGITITRNDDSVNYDIPASAWRPANYRAKTDIAIRKSFIRAVNKKQAINCYICKMPHEEYTARIEQAIKEGLIIPYKTAEGTIQYTLGSVGQRYLVEKKESILKLAIKTAETAENVTEIIKDLIHIIQPGS